jgi:NAD(P)H-dependent FMN reductase
MDDSGTMTMGGRVFNIVAFAGSLRRASYNRALLRAATELAPPGLRITVHELDDIPFTTRRLRLPAFRRAWGSSGTPFARLTGY